MREKIVSSNNYLIVHYDSTQKRKGMPPGEPLISEQRRIEGGVGPSVRL
jgi:hypothetical protein